jgi:hypothetical protein
MNWYIRAEDGQENVMPSELHPTPSEEQIRVRSYLIWEREGRPEGKSQEHWQRAKAELDAEFEANWRAASMEGETTGFVLPLLPISTPPSRSVAEKIVAGGEPKKASG